MVKSKKTLLLVVLALVAVLSVAVLTACNGGEKYKITWDVSENATVTVEGESTLPTEVEAEKTLVFSVTASKGYTVFQVLVNDRAISALKGGNYSTSIKADTVIKVETTENVESVAVKTNPDKLTYVAGEKLDATGMEVEVTYGSGRKATETNYTVMYQNGADAFSLGDTTFAVSFKGVKSSDVSLTAAVEAKIVIDPQGGTIAEDYFTALQSNTELHNLTKSEDGVISFTYSTLSAAIALPTAEQWSKGQVGDYSFVGWGAKEIATDNKESKTFTVQYKAGLVIVESIAYRAETVEGEEVPYLVISGKFNAAKEAYLYLYEGNDKVELVGDTIGGADVKRGDPFELKFDLRKLVAKSYEGKWMDIKFLAKEGSGENARIETMEIDLNDYPTNFVNVDQQLIVGDYIYTFSVYTPENTNARLLKAVYNKYFKNEYTMRGGVDSEGKMILTIEGAVSKTWAGKAVCIDYWANVSKDAYATIGEDGSYTINISIDEVPLNTDGYFHFKIVESETDHTELYKDGDGNLLNSGCINKDLQTVKIGLIDNTGALRIANSDETKVYYIGKGKWGGIVVYARNEALVSTVTTGVALEVVNEKAYLVISGTYDVANEAMIEKTLGFVQADFQSNESAGSVSKWETVQLTADNIITEGANGNWKVRLEIAAFGVENGDALICHFGFGGKSDLEFADVDKTTTITAGGFTYRLDLFTGWDNRNVVTVFVTTAEAA